MEEFISRYGLIAVFFGTMLEGDLTLVIAGVLARYGVVGFSFGEVLVTGTAGAVLGDWVSYAVGRACRDRVESLRLYARARPRLERLKGKFGTFSVFAVKYFWGLRTTSSIFWGVANFGFARFAALSVASCGAWVLLLSGVGYFFTAGVESLIANVRRLEIWFVMILGFSSLIVLIVKLRTAVLLAENQANGVSPSRSSE